jgi:hypothetical protein
MKSVLVAIFACIAVPAVAQSSLGISGAHVTTGVVEDEGGTTRVEGRAVVDVAITDVHKFQSDLSFADTEAGGVGSLGAHLYMAPRNGQKYGFFAQLSDVDGRSLTYGTIGAEGMIALNANTSLEASAGIGAATGGGLDYFYGSVGLAHAYSNAFDVSATLDLAEFDETSLRAISYDAGFKAAYSPEGAPWGVYASVNHSGLTGRDGEAGQTRIGLGLSVTFGASGGADPETRAFRSVDPVAPLLRRNLW